MERTVYQKLLLWRNDKDRKPLVLLGARQVGKTYILKEFGKHEFHNIVYVNCHNNTFASTLFNDYNIPRIIHAIEVNYEVKIEVGKTLLFFDEIQEVPGGIASLKYFCEDLRLLHVAAAGSLLGLALQNDESFPVGKVNTIKMYPMTFTEFLLAMGRNQLREAILSADWELLRHLHDLLTELLRQYYFVGGMPEAVGKWVETADPKAVRKVQNDILQTYYFDFGKHGKTMIHRIRQVWDSIPAQLAKENKKFIFGAIKKGARAADFEAAIQWLVDAGSSTRFIVFQRPNILSSSIKTAMHSKSICSTVAFSPCCPNLVPRICCLATMPLQSSRDPIPRTISCKNLLVLEVYQPITIARTTPRLK